MAIALFVILVIAALLGPLGRSSAEEGRSDLAAARDIGHYRIR
jgi:hypothetical protein